MQLFELLKHSLGQNQKYQSSLAYLVKTYFLDFSELECLKSKISLSPMPYLAKIEKLGILVKLMVKTKNILSQGLTRPSIIIIIFFFGEAWAELKKSFFYLEVTAQSALRKKF